MWKFLQIVVALIILSMPKTERELGSQGSDVDAAMRSLYPPDNRREVAGLISAKCTSKTSL